MQDAHVKVEPDLLVLGNQLAVRRVRQLLAYEIAKMRFRTRHNQVNGHDSPGSVGSVLVLLVVVSCALCLLRGVEFRGAGAGSSDETEMPVSGFAPMLCISTVVSKPGTVIGASPANASRCRY